MESICLCESSKKSTEDVDRLLTHYYDELFFRQFVLVDGGLACLATRHGLKLVAVGGSRG